LHDVNIRILRRVAGCKKKEGKAYSYASLVWKLEKGEDDKEDPFHYTVMQLDDNHNIVGYINDGRYLNGVHIDMGKKDMGTPARSEVASLP
jgi:hypothetical protein